MADIQSSTLGKLPENLSSVNGQTIKVSATGENTSTTAASYFKGMREHLQAMQLQVQSFNTAIEDLSYTNLASVSQLSRFEKQIKELETRDAASRRQIQELNQKDAASSRQIQELEHEIQELKKEGEADRRMLMYKVEQDIPLLATKFIDVARSHKSEYPELCEEADALAIRLGYEPE